jgi:nucleotide-binding universal stress UspA family protein
MFQSCLISTDLSDGLSRLKDFIPNLAKSGLKTVIFAHSVPLKDDGAIPKIDHKKIEKTQEFFAPILSQIYPDIEVKVEVVSGKPVDTIPKLIEKYQCDLVLMGSPIRSLLQEKLFGSTSASITKSTKSPLMILRPQLISTYTREELALRCEHLWQHLLIPYTGGESDNYLVENIKKIVEKHPTSIFKKCSLCWVIDEGGGSKAISDYHKQEATEKLTKVKGELESCGLEVSTVIKQGNPIQEILQVGSEYDISAIAIGLNYKKNIFQWTLPNMANDIIRHSWFPLIFFP